MNNLTAGYADQIAHVPTLTKDEAQEIIDRAARMDQQRRETKLALAEAQARIDAGLAQGMSREDAVRNAVRIAEQIERSNRKVAA